MTGDERASLAVVLATHNGAGVLPAVLNGYLQCLPIERPWRLFAIDNGSSDTTAAVLTDFASKLPLTILKEPAPGKNRALNRVLEHLGLEPIFYIFTDDDAVPSADFLKTWSEVDRQCSGYSLFGGVVQPRFSQPPPAWLLRYRAHYPELFAENNRPSGPIPAEAIFGPNMALRRSVFDRGFRFDETIGPSSVQADYPMGSETEFCVRVEKSMGAGAWFAGGPKVYHIVRAAQMTPEFIERRAYRHGRGFALRQALAGEAPAWGPRQRLIQAGYRVASALRLADSRWQYHWRKGYSEELIRQAEGSGPAVD